MAEDSLSGTPSSEVEYKGQLSFIPQNPSHPQSEKQRYAVATHIQRRYRAWRRDAKVGGKRQLNLQGLAVTPQSPSSSVGEADRDEEKLGKGSGSSSVKAGSFQSSRAAWHSSKRRPSLPTPASSPKRIKGRPVNPYTILQSGNSDPFNASPIGIGPREVEVLSFYYNNVVPIFIRYIEAVGVPPHIGRSKWHDPFSGLQDRGEAYGFLARSAVFMTRSGTTDNDLNTRALMYRNKSSELLRSRLAGGEGTINEQEICRIVLSLLITSVVEESLDAALVHARLLNYLLKEQSKSQDHVNLDLLFAGLWYDFHRASMSLTKPAFEVSGWVSQQLLPSWRQARRELPPLSGNASSDLDPTVSATPLRGLFVAIREFSEIQSMVASDPNSVPPSSLVSLASYMLACQCQILERYLNILPRTAVYDDHLQAVSSANETPGLSTAAEVKARWLACALAYACLAAIHWTRHAIKIENVPIGQDEDESNKIRVFNAGKTILPTLRQTLIKTDLVSMNRDATQNARVRLWALYVGAMAEWTDVQPSPTGKWFSGHFATQARNMGLILWSDVRKVLRGFLYSDHLRPHGSEWFAEACRIEIPGEVD